jgi:hypothetical protein
MMEAKTAQKTFDKECLNCGPELWKDPQFKAECGVCTSLCKQRIVTALYLKSHGLEKVALSLASLRTVNLKNKDKLAAQQRDYRLKNKDKLSAQKRDYYLKNKDKLSAQKRDYRLKNKDKLAAQQRDYYLKNKDKLAAQQRDYYLKNKDKYYAYQRKWQREHQESFKASQKASRQRRRDRTFDSIRPKPVGMKPMQSTCQRDTHGRWLSPRVDNTTEPKAFCQGSLTSTPLSFGHEVFLKNCVRDQSDRPLCPIHRRQIRIRSHDPRRKRAVFRY